MNRGEKNPELRQAIDSANSLVFLAGSVLVGVSGAGAIVRDWNGAAVDTLGVVLYTMFVIGVTLLLVSKYYQRISMMTH